jgi:hypothetical protein
MTTKKRKSISSPKIKQEFSRAPDFRSIYANWVQATFSPHDISMMVGESFQTGPQIVGVEHKARIIFSPLEGKLLSVILRKIVETYETQFGEIVVPHVIGDQLVDQLPEIMELMAPKTEND